MTWCALFLCFWAGQEGPQDVVTLRDGSSHIGTIMEDTIERVRLRPARGPMRTFEAAEVASVEYGDAPREYKDALALRAGGQAAQAAQRMQEILTMVREKRANPRAHPNLAPVRDWFEPYATFYLAECLWGAGDYRGAIARYDEILQQHERFRLLAKAYEGLMACYVATGDGNRAAELLARIQQQSGRLGSDLLDSLRVMYIDLLMNSDPKRVVAELEPLISSANEGVAVDAARKIFDAYATMGRDPQEAANRMSASPHASVRTIAAIRTGEAALRAARSGADYLRACALLRDAVIVQFPGKGCGLEAEHRAGLMALGRAYEGAAASASGEEARNHYRAEARRIYRLLAALYPQSAEAGEASERASALGEEAGESGGRR
jgi:tetratricopeptide (TPR) repeat protein